MRLHRCGVRRNFVQYMIKKKSQISVEDSRLSQIGSRVRALRKANTSLSAEDFANEKGFDRVQYSRIENGANITMKTLLKVVDAHNITLKEFFSDLDYAPSHEKKYSCSL